MGNKVFLRDEWDFGQCSIAKNWYSSLKYYHPSLYMPFISQKLKSTVKFNKLPLLFYHKNANIN
jgi:hypothetical protein